MPSTYKTPGVYVEEISKFPPSVAQVDTAVPAFIGYTEIAIKNGESLFMKPTMVTSLLEYQLYFGGDYVPAPGDITVITDEPTNNYAVQSVQMNKTFYMFSSLRLFFDNGGGKCYIVALDSYDNANFTNGILDDTGSFISGLDEVKKYDDPTILLFPDAALLDEAPFYTLQQAAIEQSAALQDRVALLDLKENIGDWAAARDDFRNGIGINDLKYGMAYTPWVYNAYTYNIDFALFKDNVFTASNLVTHVDLSIITSNPTLNSLVTAVDNSADDLAVVNGFIDTNSGSAQTIQDNYNILRNAVVQATSDPNAITAFTNVMALVRNIAQIFPTWRTTTFKNDNLKQDLDNLAGDSINGLRKYVTDLVKYEANNDVDSVTTGAAATYTTYDNVPVAAPDSWLGANVATIPTTPAVPNYGAGANKATAVAALNDLDPIFLGLNTVLNKLLASAQQRHSLAEMTLYGTHPAIGNIVTAIQKQYSVAPPSGPVAGVYAKVDNDRGVWKAPANVSLSSVVGPTVIIDNITQDDLNVDVNAGKSINAIRAFTGKGTLVWGARTLAGNDNEWRYVPVRRFFNMVEESVKKASSQFVFEPNDANTWVKVKAMIENFLTILWRQGALAGAKPDQAFYVNIGLGTTMTAIDILEGRMNVEIGMAAVRPAEFIILKFSHKMQES